MLKNAFKCSIATSSYTFAPGAVPALRGVKKNLLPEYIDPRIDLCYFIPHKNK